MTRQNRAEVTAAIKNDQEDIEDAVALADPEAMTVIQEVGQGVDQAEVIGVTVDVEEEAGRDL